MVGVAFVKIEINCESFSPSNRALHGLLSVSEMYGRRKEGSLFGKRM